MADTLAFIDFEFTEASTVELQKSISPKIFLFKTFTHSRFTHVLLSLPIQCNKMNFTFITSLWWKVRLRSYKNVACIYPAKKDATVKAIPKIFGYYWGISSALLTLKSWRLFFAALNEKSVRSFSSISWIFITNSRDFATKTWNPRRSAKIPGWVI